MGKGKQGCEAHISWDQKTAVEYSKIRIEEAGKPGFILYYLMYIVKLLLRADLTGMHYMTCRLLS